MIVFTNARVFEGLMDAHIDANFQDMNEWNSECERIDPDAVTNYKINRGRSQQLTTERCPGGAWYPARLAPPATLTFLPGGRDGATLDLPMVVKPETLSFAADTFLDDPLPYAFDT